MASRGIWSMFSTRTRRGLTLSWVVLFIFSILLQYGTFTNPSPVDAVHAEGFELDGNTVDAAGGGTDWDAVYNDVNTFFANDAVSSSSDDIFKGGGSKDNAPITDWLWTNQNVQDKDDIVTAYAFPISSGGDLIAWFGQDRLVTNGDAVVGFWFFKGPVSKSNTASQGGFKFNGTHTVGDILVLADFSNGGSNGEVFVYKWVGSGGDTEGVLDCLRAPVATATCAADNDDAIAVINDGGAINAAWRAGIPQNAFFEGGINLTNLALDEGCFSSFMAHSRSSTSFDSTNSDFVLGEFSFCVEPDLSTQVSQSSISVGDAGVTDTASLSGDNGVPAGTVDFFLCGPTISAQNCASGGADAGQNKAVDGSGNAVSNAMSPTAPGWYCFRAEYTPATGAKYLPTSHTNNTTECFQVLPANVTISKTADAGTVSAGSQIGFTISWGNSGPGEAKGVVVSDNLPGAAGLDWSIQGSTGSGSTCSISGAVGSEVLTCNVGTIAGNTANAGSVHLVSGTTSATCGVVNNTGEISSTNDGSDDSSAGITVQCPDLQVTKTPDGGTINAGDQISFSIEVENLGPGTANGVVLTDNLPAEIDWSTSTPGCSISGSVGSEVLTCNVGTLASGATFTAVVTGPTSADDCTQIDNTGSATATNEPASALGNNSDDGSVTVLCAQIQVLKTANPAGPVNAGDTIGFDITVINGGAGTALGVELSDNLPGDPGLDWSLDAPTGDTVGVVCGISGAVGSQVLTCTDGSMSSGQSFTVHVSSGTTASSCGDIDNLASVTTSNDGSDEDGASVTVACSEIDIVKTADAAEVVAGDPIGFTITVSNLGDGTAYDVEVSDTLPAGFDWQIYVAGSDPGWSIAGGSLGYGPADLAGGASVSVHIVAATSFETCGPVNNTAVVTTSNDGTAQDSAATSVRCPVLTIEKDLAGNTGGTTVDGFPEAEIGDTLTYTLTYSLAEGPVTNGVITDTLPIGLDYVDGSAAGNAEFSFTSYDAATRVLTWNAPTVTTGGSVTYEVTVLAGADELVQPLINVATIDSDETDPDDATAQVFVAPPPLAATGTPTVTLPPTSTTDQQSTGSSAGFALMLTLLALAGLVFGMGYVTPAPARVRRPVRRR